MSHIAFEIMPYRLPYRRPLVTATGTWRERSGTLVRLTDGSGTSGYGDAAPWPFWAGRPQGPDPACDPGGGPPGRPDHDLTALRWLAAMVVEELARVELPAEPGALADLLDRLTVQYSPGRLPAAGGPPGPDSWSALSAIALALADLAARRAGLPLCRWLEPEAAARVPVNALVDAVPGTQAARLAQRAVGEGYGTIKVKLGGEPQADLARVAAVRSAVGDAVRIRLDANGAWAEAEAGQMLSRMAELGIELVEQPVAGAEVEALARLRRSSPVPIAADETLALEGLFDQLLWLRAVDVVVLKPSLLGGPLAAMERSRRAAACGIASVVTSALESAVGRTGALHVAAALAALPGPSVQGAGGLASERLAHGLATGQLLARDVAASAPVVNGAIEVGSAPGLGLDPPGPFVRLTGDGRSSATGRRHATPGPEPIAGRPDAAESRS